MTISQYLPQWLQSWLQSWLHRSAPQKGKVASKKDRQVLPTVPKAQTRSSQLDDDGAPLRFRVYWRM